MKYSNKHENNDSVYKKLQADFEIKIQCLET